MLFLVLIIKYCICFLNGHFLVELKIFELLMVEVPLSPIALIKIKSFNPNKCSHLAKNTKSKV